MRLPDTAIPDGLNAIRDPRGLPRAQGPDAARGNLRARTAPPAARTPTASPSTISPIQCLQKIGRQPPRGVPRQSARDPVLHYERGAADPRVAMRLRWRSTPTATLLRGMVDRLSAHAAATSAGAAACWRDQARWLTIRPVCICAATDASRHQRHRRSGRVRRMPIARRLPRPALPPKSPVSRPRRRARHHQPVQLRGTRRHTGYTRHLAERLDRRARYSLRGRSLPPTSTGPAAPPPC